MYTAYLLLCMVTPVGGEYCTPAVPKLVFELEKQCKSYIAREKKYIREESSLEEFRPYLPTIKEGRLRFKSACSTPIEKEWLGREIPVAEIQIGG